MRNIHSQNRNRMVLANRQTNAAWFSHLWSSYLFVIGVVALIASSEAKAFVTSLSIVCLQVEVSGFAFLASFSMNISLSEEYTDKRKRENWVYEGWREWLAWKKGGFRFLIQKRIQWGVNGRRILQYKITIRKQWWGYQDLISWKTALLVFALTMTYDSLNQATQNDLHIAVPFLILLHIKILRDAECKKCSSVFPNERICNRAQTILIYNHSYIWEMK